RFEARERFGDRADLVGLEQHRVAGALCILYASSGGDEEIVAHDLHPLPRSLREGAQGSGVMLGERVLERNDGITLEPGEVYGVQLRRRERAILQREVVALAAPELCGG